MYAEACPTKGEVSFKWKFIIDMELSLGWKNIILLCITDVG